MNANSFLPAMDSVDASNYYGRGFMYVAVCSGPEDMIKVGFSHDPLARFSAFHPRWFEAFDLDHSLLIETETRPMRRCSKRPCIANSSSIIVRHP